MLLSLLPISWICAHEGSGSPHHHDTGESGTDLKHVRITVRDDFRYIESDGLPGHSTGRFPNRGNPNSIRSQRYEFRVPLHPTSLETPVPIRHQPFGVALNGVVFDPGTAEFWHNDPRSGWNYDAFSGKLNLGLDTNNAHVQPNGAYHYHGIPTGLIRMLGGNDKRMLLVGYAADGFPIYAPRCHKDANDSHSELDKMKSSYRLKNGVRSGEPGGKFDGTFVEDWEYVAGSGNLDECNGRTGVTPEYPDGTYYYVLTEEFPFIPRLFRGGPDASFERHGPPGGGPPRGRPPRNRRAPVPGG